MSLIFVIFKAELSRNDCRFYCTILFIKKCEIRNLYIIFDFSISYGPETGKKTNTT